MTTSKAKPKQTHSKLPEIISGQWPGAFKTFDAARALVRRNPLVVLAYVGVSVASVLLVAQFPMLRIELFEIGKLKVDQNYLSILSLLVFAIILPVYALRLADGKPVSKSAFIRRDWKWYLRVEATVMLSLALIVAPSALQQLPNNQYSVIYGLIGVAAAIAFTSWFALAFLISADKNASPATALKASKTLLKGHLSELWVMILLYMIVSLLLAAIGSGLDSFVSQDLDIFRTVLSSVLNVFFIVNIALLYRWIEQNRE